MVLCELPLGVVVAAASSICKLINRAASKADFEKEFDSRLFCRIDQELRDFGWILIVCAIIPLQQYRPILK